MCPIVGPTIVPCGTPVINPSTHTLYFPGMRTCKIDIYKPPFFNKHNLMQKSQMVGERIK